MKYLKHAIMEILFHWNGVGDAGVWNGYSALVDALIDERYYCGSTERVKNAVRELCSDGELVRSSTWNEGKLSGSGYFLKSERETMKKYAFPF